jgi:hypothetical protein
MSTPAAPSFPKTHNVPPSQPMHDPWADLRNGFASIVVGAIAAVGSMALGTLL